MDKKGLIEMENISKRYFCGENEVRALDGVCISVGKGEFLSIVGKSGSGKSTLMNIMGCLDVQSSGSYTLNGKEVSELDKNELAKIRNRMIGFIFQGYNLIPELDAVENVELPLFYRGVEREVRRRRAIEALEKVGVIERKRHRPSQMSGGQQQRVAIARAIAADPPIILADEPTGNLDESCGEEIMSILCGMHEEGKTIIVITHDAAVARRAQRIVKISDGRLTEMHEMQKD